MPTDRNTLAPLDYWKASRQPQRFYIAFCLLMSSIQDWALGRKEAESQNFNWSATCSYYSLVHAGRLLSFLALGDFPTRHFELGEMLKPGAQARVQPDWVRRFTRGAATSARENAGDLRQVIIQYLGKVGVHDPSQDIDRFGVLLSGAKDLRDDSNYEALLIAHEYRHRTVSDAFQQLAQCIGDAAESQLPLVIQSFHGFIDRDLVGERIAYWSFVREYLAWRLVPAIERKLPHSPSVRAKVQEVVATIQIPTEAAAYDHLEKAVSLDLFDPKKRLMESFVNKIGRFCPHVNQDGRNG